MIRSLLLKNKKTRIIIIIFTLIFLITWIFYHGYTNPSTFGRHVARIQDAKGIHTVDVYQFFDHAQIVAWSDSAFDDTDRYNIVTDKRLDSSDVEVHWLNMMYAITKNANEILYADVKIEHEDDVLLSERVNFGEHSLNELGYAFKVLNEEKNK